ncbi:MAG: ArsR family transcriptional regulator [Bacteroidota bacterium]
MIETLISSKTRIKLLLKFFLNSETTSYLRNLETEFGESTNAIRLELNKFEKAGMLQTEFEGNKKLFKANTSHPLFKDLNNIVFKYVGLDWIVDHLVEKLGDLESVYLIGSFSKGLDSDTVELIFVGKVDEKFLKELCSKFGRKINRKIVYHVVEKLLNKDTNSLLLWSKEKRKKNI